MVAGPAEAQHLAGGDRRSRDAGAGGDAQAGVDIGAAVARKDRPALAPGRFDEPGGQPGVARVAADGLGGIVQRLLDGLGRAQGPRDLGDHVQPGRAAVGLLAQRRAAQGGGHLLGQRSHEQRVGVVELVGSQVAEADHRLAATVDHDRGRQQRLIPGRRPGATRVGQVRAAEQRLSPRPHDLADDARVERVRRHRHRVAAPGDRPHPLRALAVVGHGRPHRGVVGVAMECDRDGAQELLHAAGGGDLARQIRRQLQSLGPPLRLVLKPRRVLAEPHTHERGRDLVGRGLHQSGVGGIEPVRLAVGQLEHAFAAALDHHRRQEQRLPAAVGRPRVARVGRGLGEHQLGLLADAGTDEAGLEIAPDRLRRRDVAAEVDDDELLLRFAVDHRRGDARVPGVLEHDGGRHPEGLVHGGGCGDGARDRLHHGQLLGAQVGTAGRGDRMRGQVAHRREQARLLAEGRSAGVAADDERRHRIAVDPDRRREARAALGAGRQRVTAGQRQHQRPVGAQREAGAVGDLAQRLRRELLGHRRIVLRVGMQSLRKMGEVAHNLR